MKKTNIILLGLAAIGIYIYVKGMSTKKSDEVKTGTQLKIKPGPTTEAPSQNLETTSGSAVYSDLEDRIMPTGDSVKTNTTTNQIKPGGADLAGLY